MKKSIGKTLKKYRIDMGFSVEDICIILKENGYNISPKTVYGWESGTSSPRLEIFLILCIIYKIEDIPSAFLHNNERATS